mgnify:CR=1 FL=1
MADLLTLFHNPESLSDNDLARVRRKIKRQTWTPWVTTAAFAGLASLKCRSPQVLGVAGVAGFLFGARLSMYANPNPSGYEQVFDKDIMDAFENRYIRF